MAKPRLLILSRELIALEEDLEHSLSVIFSGKISGAAVKGAVSVAYSLDNLLKWAVLGKSTDQNCSLCEVQRGCELYIGIRTLKREYSGQKTEDGKFDIFQLGERGFDLAKQNGIPAILLDHYNLHDISDFIGKQTALGQM